MLIYDEAPSSSLVIKSYESVQLLLPLLIYLRMQRRSQNVTAAFCSFIPVVTSMLVAKGKDPRFEEERMDGGMLRSRGKGQGRRTRGGGRGGAAAG